MNPTQLVTVFSVSVITICLVILTYWIVSILKTFKDTVSKTNQILDNAKLITDDISAPVSQLKEFFGGIKEGINFVSKFFNKDDI